MKLILCLFFLFVGIYSNSSNKFFKTPQDVETYLYFKGNKVIRDASDAALVGFRRQYLEYPGKLKEIDVFGQTPGSFKFIYESNKGKSAVTVRVDQRRQRTSIEKIEKYY